MSGDEEPIPGHPSQVTAGWLTATLREAAVLRGASVVDAAWQIIGEDRGFTGVVARVDIRYSAPSVDAPHSLVAKFPTAVRSIPSIYARAASRDARARQRAYERATREVHVYGALGPEELAAAPHLYFGAANPDPGSIILLLEDLTGGMPGDVLRGCCASEADSVCAAIAPFHVQWWQCVKLRTFPWLPIWGQDLAARAKRYSECAAPFLGRFGDRMPDEARRLVRHLAGGYTSVLGQLLGAPTTAIHGDLHLDNVIFTPGSTRPVRVIDWQGVMSGPAVLDLTFVANSLPIDQRRMFERDLLHRYHAALRAGGIRGYPYDLLEHHYRLALLANLAGFVTWLGSTDLEGLAGRERAMMDAVVEEPRLLTALLDHKVEMLLD